MTNLVIEKILRSIVNSFIIGILFCTPRKKKPRDVLVVKIDALGDFVIFLPALIRYKTLFPGKRLVLLLASHINKQIADRLLGTYIDEVILLEDKRYAKKILYRLLFSLKIYKKHFETVIYPVYFRRFIGDFLVLATRTQQAIGFSGYRVQEENDRSFSKHYTTLLTLPVNVSNEFYKHKYMLEQLSGCHLDNYDPFFPLQEEDRANAGKLLSEHHVPSRYVVVFPGSGSPFRNWPIDKFKEVISYLHSVNLHVVLCGSKEESVITQKIISLFGNPSLITDLSGLTTSIFQLASIIEQSQMYIGGDTGPTHVSAAVHTPTICLMGGGVFREFFPYGNKEKNRIVYDKNMTCRNDNWKCTQNIPYGSPAPCIKNISVKDVIEEINFLLEKQK